MDVVLEEEDERQEAGVPDSNINDDTVEDVPVTDTAAPPDAYLAPPTPPLPSPPTPAQDSLQPSPSPQTEEQITQPSHPSEVKQAPDTRPIEKLPIEEPVCKEEVVDSPPPKRILTEEERMLMWEKTLDQYLDRERTYGETLRLQMLDPRTSSLEIVFRKKRKMTEEISFSDEQLAEVGQKPEALVPIRLDIELEGLKLRDTFTWNLNESVLTPDHFAKVLCTDLHLPPSLFFSTDSKSIKEQVDDYYQHAPTPPELRMIIKLDITIGNHSLDPEFKTAISHQIREQVQTFAKSLLLVDHHFDGSPIDDEDLAACFLPSIEPSQVQRGPKAKSLFGPYYNQVSDFEIEKMEKDRERDVRRKRRQTQRSRRAVALPDREAPKTSRTGVVHYNPHDIPDPLVATPFGTPVGRRNPPRRHRGAMMETPVPAATHSQMPIKEHEPPQPPPPLPTEHTLIRGWRCQNCGISAKRTPLLRIGPTGERTLCDECGLYQNRTGRARPVTPPPSGYLNTISPERHPSAHGLRVITQQANQRVDGTSLDVNPAHGSFNPHHVSSQQQHPFYSQPLGSHSQHPHPSSSAHSSVFAPQVSAVPPLRPQQQHRHSNHPDYQAQQPSPRIAIPEWLQVAHRLLASRYPVDNFEVVEKGKTGELRMKCYDCPGKLYQAGPMKSLNNFEIHLKNRQHRANVNSRVGQPFTPTVGNAPSSIVSGPPSSGAEGSIRAGSTGAASAGFGSVAGRRTESRRGSLEDDERW
ncbi:hypothetical protein DFS34DRAFT_678201 [Phlyctochytrium arcticum]|nr:hypothetical protein DFS34DRAFT_678201 [Phlyctochytrium arcticum]